MPDFGIREMIVMVSLAIVIIGLGLFPGSILNATRQTVQEVIEKSQSPGALPQNTHP